MKRIPPVTAGIRSRRVGGMKPEMGHDLRHSERAGHQDRPGPEIVILAMGVAKKAAHAIDRKVQE